MSEPAVDSTESLAFKDAVTKAAAEAVARLLKESRAEHGTEDRSGDPTWMRALAMEIAQLTDQGTGRGRRVAPEILKSRQEGHDRMIKLIVDARAGKKTASYRVRVKTLLADRVVEPVWIKSDHTAQPTIIDWDGIPNDAMIPENDVAKEIFAAYAQWIGSSTRVVPEDALAVTPGGLVVHGGAASISSGRRQVQVEASQTGGPEKEEEGGLRVHHRNAPGRFVETRILGSIMEPARQTSQ